MLYGVFSVRLSLKYAFGTAVAISQNTTGQNGKRGQACLNNRRIRSTEHFDINKANSFRMPGNPANFHFRSRKRFDRLDQVYRVAPKRFQSIGSHCKLDPVSYRDLGFPKQPTGLPQLMSWVSI